MRCLWRGCLKDVPDVQMMAHLGESHVGYIRDKTFKNKCEWDDCVIHQSNRSKMISHLVSHIDLRLYQCKCLRKFKRKGDLVAHQKKNCKAFFDDLVGTLFNGLQ